MNKLPCAECLLVQYNWRCCVGKARALINHTELSSSTITTNEYELPYNWRQNEKRICDFKLPSDDDMNTGHSNSSMFIYSSFYGIKQSQYLARKFGNSEKCLSQQQIGNQHRIGGYWGNYPPRTDGPPDVHFCTLNCFFCRINVKLLRAEESKPSYLCCVVLYSNIVVGCKHSLR